MYTREQVDSIFSGAISRLNEYEKPFHVITTNHPYMAELGLSSFTVQELYQWLSRANKNNFYVNSFVFTGVSNKKNKQTEETDVKGAATQIFPDTSTELKFSVWRKYYNNSKYIGGKYIETNLRNWEFKTATQTYSFADIALFNSFGGCRIDYSYEGPKKADSFSIDNTISNIINMNDWYRYNLMLKDRSQYKDDDNVVHEFILDIKSSLEKCLTWTKNIRFYLNINKHCIKEEDVTFKLFLYDENKVRDDSRKLSISNPIIIQPKTDMFNRVGSFENGEFSPANPQDVSSYTPGEIDMHYNSSTGKWESGTKQTLAMLKQDIEAATIPSLNLIEKGSMQTLLEPGSTFVFPTGLAYPITSQNSNPQQFSTTYKKSKNCRGEDTEKFEIIATNANPVPYSSGQTVMLSRIDGAWIIGELYTAKENVVDETVEDKWDFMYIFANYDNYFRTKLSSNGSFLNSEEFHDSIVNRYYFNSEGYNDQEDKNLNYDNSFREPDVDNSYFQVTSWDFMGTGIGGLRKSNALGRTVFTLNEDGSTSENGGKFLYNDDSCTPFFGCCFPDGYDAELKYQDYMNPDSSTTYHTVSPPGNNADNLFFHVPVKGRVFENSNGIKPTISEGIFKHNIRHLPADIALNSSENGTYGSPLKNIKSFDIMNNDVSRSKIREYFFQNKGIEDSPQYQRQIRNYWLYINNNPHESFFDFKPVNPNKISFRPLRAEVYAAYESQDYYDNGVQVDSFGIAAKKQLLLDPSEPIISTIARNRNLFNNDKNNTILQGEVEDKYLVYNKDLQDIVNFRNYSDGANYDPFLWENKPWLDYEGAAGGAVGIIAAQKTLKTGSDIIRFTTDNFIGMPSRLIGLGLLSRWIPTYGSADGYLSFNTTQLFAKIYHAWPREQTIYDPRFFTVFHFNDGVNLLNSDSTKKLYHTPTGVFPDKPVDFPDPESHNDDYKIEYVEESSVDIRIPTLKNGLYIKSSGHKVFSNGLKFGGSLDDDNLYEFHLDQKFWYIEPKRRSKILPYKYKYYTIGIDATPYNASNKSGSIHIEAKGQDYLPSDTFTVIGGNGNGVILKPILGEIGNVNSFEVIDPGRGFLPSDFVKEGDAPSYSQLKIVCDRAVANPLSAYVKNGLTVETSAVDAKPQLATSETEIRLTPQIKTAPSDQIAGANAMTDQLLVTEAQIVNKNTMDYKYDIFFHFHNDISHTFYLDTWSPGIPTYDQNITLEITTA